MFCITYDALKVLQVLFLCRVQFRSVQKRLLVRFKERNPAPVAHLDILLQGTYDELLELGSAYEERQLDLRRAATEVSLLPNFVQILFASLARFFLILRMPWSWRCHVPQGSC